MIDLHVHILPGIDDGPSDMEESVEMCRMALEDGATAIVASPHMFNGVFNVTREDIIGGVERLRKRLESESLPLVVNPGADMRAVPELPELIRGGQAMTVGDHARHAMLELPSDVLPQGLRRLIFSIQLLGIVPIISHPERNLAVQADPAAMTEFVEAGALVQLTAGSVTGDFGRVARECSHKLLGARLAHLVASDAHSPTRRPPGLSRAFAEARRFLSEQEVDEIFVHRPLSIFSGERVDLPEPMTPTPHKKRIFSFRTHASR